MMNKNINNQNISNQNIIIENSTIDKYVQDSINKLISYFEVFNNKILYMYLEKNNIEYIIYKCYHKASEYEIGHYNLKHNILIYINIIYNNKYKTISFDIEIKNENNKNITINNYNVNIYELDINKIISFYIGTLKQLNKSLEYINTYKF